MKRLFQTCLELPLHLWVMLLMYSKLYSNKFLIRVQELFEFAQNETE